MFTLENTKYLSAAVLCVILFGCTAQIPLTSNKYLSVSVYYDSKTQETDNTGVMSSPDFIYPERYFIVEGIKQLNGITAIKVTYPKNKKIRCTILSIDGDLDGYDNLKEIRVNDTAFLNLLPVYITESNEKALKMIPDSIQVNPDPWYPIYSHLKPEVWDELISRNYTYTGFNIDADYSDGGLYTARNLVGKYLIQDGATSPNMPDRFFIRAWDYAHTGAIPSFGKVFKVYIRK